ncbi:carboxypeptidase regulatory-like domain-containing protein [candidate division KSB1 bacterium]|nr:carboxypeptidase regulatory-like domain-containing protein [candidate division KSB1 bacterium]
MIKRFLLVLFVFVTCIILPQCKKDNPSEPKPPSDSLVGTVKSADGSPIHPAFIFLNDSLLAETGSTGQFSVETLTGSQILLICSALGYADETAQISIQSGKQASVDFVLSADTTKGRVYGEFQDLVWFKNALLENPDLKDWDEKQMWQAVTGATMQSMTMGELPPRQVYIGDEHIRIADDFGQFWVEVQCGTYAFKGVCDGYKTDVQVLKVLPEQKHYIIFYLDPQ